jgi:hypothetical protein
MVSLTHQRLFPNDRAVIRLVGAFMIEANDEWTLTRRYMALESLTRMGNTEDISLPAIAVAGTYPTEHDQLRVFPGDEASFRLVGAV